MASQFFGYSKCTKSRRFLTCPLSHPFVERLIGTIRREYLDRTLFWTTADLETKFFHFRNYYNGHRTHAGREGTPVTTQGRRIWITDRPRLVSLAETLSNVVPHSNRRMILNSPRTREQC